MAQKADGMMTDERQIVLGIQTADCVPVLVADRETGAVAAFHAGWRGTVQGIVQSGVGRMCAEYGCRPGRLVAAVGPCIGVCCYVVGPEVRAEFAAAFGYAGVLFAEGAELPRSKGSESAATAGCRAGCGGDRGNAGVHGVCPGAFFFIPGGAGEYRKDAGGDSGATGESCGVGRACWWCLRVAGSAARRDSVG
jgi:copper oxidase (laccase) domain-containing protein